MSPVEWCLVAALVVLVWLVFDIVALLTYAAIFATACGVGIAIQWLFEHL